VFRQLTRSICPACNQPIDAKIILRDGKVFMRKRCPDHGRCEALVYADSEAYTSQAKFNKTGTSRWPTRATSSTAAHATAADARTTSNTLARASSKSVAPAICSARCALPMLVQVSA
jgi:uncharacterized radical SAM superfamily Fe-S cluster-containing enzyme